MGSWLSEPGGWEGEMGNYCLMAVEFQFCKIKKKFTEQCEYSSLLNSTFKDFNLKEKF